MTPFSWNVRCQVSWAVYLRIVFLELPTLLISSLKCCDYRHAPYLAHFPWFLILLDSGFLQVSFSLLRISTIYSGLLTRVLLQEYYLILFSRVVDSAYVALLVRYYCQLDTVYLGREDFNWKIKTLAWGPCLWDFFLITSWGRRNKLTVGSTSLSRWVLAGWTWGSERVRE